MTGTTPGREREALLEWLSDQRAHVLGVLKGQFYADVFSLEAQPMDEDTAMLRFGGTAEGTAAVGCLNRDPRRNRPDLVRQGQLFGDGTPARASTNSTT
jgi:hypothetical protein